MYPVLAWVTDRKGNVLDNGKLVYGQTFAIYALAEYYMATGDERGIEYAEKTFDALKKYAADTFYGGYFENFKEDWTLESAGVYGGDLKSLDIHMHTMEAYTTLYEATHKEVHKQRKSKQGGTRPTQDYFLQDSSRRKRRTDERVSRKRRQPNLTTLLEIAQLLSVDMKELITDETERTTI